MSVNAFIYFVKDTSVSKCFSIPLEKKNLDIKHATTVKRFKVHSFFLQNIPLNSIRNYVQRKIKEMNLISDTD
ncbi:hypothetical protein Trydic_g3937 [Trypoxylus dichotomus]